MNRVVVAILVVATVLAAACSQPASPSSRLPAVPHDPSSFANVDAFVAKHLTLDLTADFTTKTLSGSAELIFDRRDANASEVVLDTRDLEIRKVEAAANGGAWADTAHRLDAATPAFGSALRITMPSGADRVRILYSSSPTAKGLQWLTPSQTAGKKQPFLFSQAEAIQARSFIPLQDTPAVRITYEATIRTPKDLVAVMAAEMSLPPPSPTASARLADGSGALVGSGVFRFRMPQAIPSYLIAIAIGDLTFKSIGERSGVWAEPSMVEAAAKEFEDTEQMIKTTESLYGPYRWGRCDLLVLPPSFPFGGMENPRLTFATPTVIAGDKSLVALVAHELAHSWSGNLVTNATWRDFWLNEGFTVYIERRIVEAVYGKRVADMHASIGVTDLKEARKTITVPGDRTLMPDLTGRDPDDAYTSVPYEQGVLFLKFLEAKYGRDAFDAFLRKWFDEHAFKSVTTDEFLATLKSTLMAANPTAVTDAQIQEWLHTEGIPSFALLPTSDAFDKVDHARDAWLKGASIDTLAKTASAWSTQEWMHFIDSLPRQLSAAQLTALDHRFKLTQSQNAEIAHVWFRLAIANHYTSAYPAMERYMIRIGRRKLIVPLYRDLAATPEGLAMANKIFAKARDGYHPLAQASVAEVLKPKA